MARQREATKGHRALQRLIGTWEFEASVDGRFMGRGSTTFEWTEDGAFVLQHADDEPSADSPADWVAHSPMPVRAVIGWDDTVDEYAMLYADARAVFRIYRMRLTDDMWTVWRDAPGFFQRFIASFPNDMTIRGRWEASKDGTAWEPDFEMVYRKRGDHR
jgi:hypothetical protein